MMKQVLSLCCVAIVLPSILFAKDGDGESTTQNNYRTYVTSSENYFTPNLNENIKTSIKFFYTKGHSDTGYFELELENGEIKISHYKTNLLGFNRSVELAPIDFTVQFVINFPQGNNVFGSSYLYPPDLISKETVSFPGAVPRDTRFVIVNVEHPPKYGVVFSKKVQALADKNFIVPASCLTVFWGSQ